MKGSELPKRLSYQDAAFTNFERETMPMNVGSVGVYDGAIPFRGFLDHLERRIDLVPRYRQRLVRVPLDLAHAVWVDDPEFDTHRHVEHARLPPPGTREQLAEFAAEFFATPLRRDKPLWEMRLVDGLEDGRTAHVAKVHHSMIDGISGVGLLAALLDLEPRVANERRRTRRRTPPPAPGSFELITDAIFDGIIDQMRMNERLLLALADPVSVLKMAQDIARAFNAAGKYFLMPAPVTPWSMRLSGPKKLAWQTLPFAEVRGVAKALGGTINEVVLTSLAGAFGRYLEARGESTQGLVLRAATPVNVRGEHEGETLGNRVSFMLIGLPVGEHNPLARFEAIHAESRLLKDIGQAQGVDDLLRLIGMSPAPVHALLGRSLSLPNTLSNLVCTNLPGPLVPLYLMGHRMVEHYPWVPLGWRMGMSVAVMSYDTGLAVSVSGDEHAPDDVRLVAPYVGDAFRELREAAGVAPVTAPEQAEAPRDAARASRGSAA